MVAAAPAVPLKDVEWRLDSEPKEFNGKMRARFVPHINARTAAALMDEWVGPLCWSDEYRTVTIAGKEALLCTVSVWDGERWVSKQDVGVPSHTEPQKGGISDAFKRTVTVKWGAGRNVYELPTLWASCKAVKGGDGKTRGYANDDTLPELLRQLKAKGFDADGRLEDGASDENAEAEKVEGQRLPEPASQVASVSRREPNATGASMDTSEPASATSHEGSAKAGSSSRLSPPQDDDPAQIASKNRLGQLQAKLKMMQGTGFKVDGHRRAANLPPLSKECTPDELERWAALLNQHDKDLTRVPV